MDRPLIIVLITAEYKITKLSQKIYKPKSHHQLNAKTSVFAITHNNIQKSSHHSLSKNIFSVHYYFKAVNSTSESGYYSHMI